ncbi:hypothetical protein MKW94_000272, partial [Papaver nudicaule]|nr:hypothetical protein [Papaver nudicaule]
VFSTAADNLTQVGVRVLQGQREMASDNKLLGKFELMGIDANGVVTQQITIKSSGGLSDCEIEKMVREAELHAQKGQERKSLIDMKNILIIYKDKIPGEVVKEIEDAISDLRQASAGDNVDEIKANKAINKIGQHMSGGAGGDSSASSGGAKGGEQPPEAEDEEVKK